MVDVFHFNEFDSAIYKSNGKCQQDDLFHLIQDMEIIMLDI